MSGVVKLLCHLCSVAILVYNNNINEIRPFLLRCVMKERDLSAMKDWGLIF